MEGDTGEIASTVVRAKVPLRSRIMRGVLFGGLRYVLIAPIPLLMTPLILHHIGPSGYGTWAIFLAINGLTTLADLGLVGTISKFVADLHARKDFFALGTLLNSGLVLFLALDLIIAGVFWWMSPTLAVWLLHGIGSTTPELTFLLRCFVWVIAANILSQLFSSVTVGLQRLDVANIVSTANALLSALCGGILLVRGWGLRGLVFGQAVSGLVTVVTYLILVRRLLPQVVLNPLRFDLLRAKKLFEYSIRLYITQAAVVVHNQVEKVFLAMMVGVVPVGWYDIGSDLALKVRGLISVILSPILPAASELNALSDASRIEELYFRSQKYLAVCSVPAVFYVIAISHRFIDLWLGPQMRAATLPLDVLLLANVFNLATGPGFLISAGTGHLKPGIQSAMLGLVINIFLSLALIARFGFTGAVVGTSVSLLLASAYFMSMFHAHTGYSIGRVLRESYFKPIVCSTLATLFLFGLRRTGDLSWVGLGGMGIAFGLCYCVAIFVSEFFDDYDWKMFERVLSTIGVARRVFRSA